MNNKRINVLVDMTKMILIIVSSCFLVYVIIVLVSDVPREAVKSFFLGPFSTLRRFGNIIEAATPLMFTGLAVIIIFRSGQFSMISEGAFFVGACGAMIAGISWTLPPIIHPVVSILFGALLGALAAGIPAVLKFLWGTSELVVSIMLNYVCMYFSLYIMNYHYRDTTTTAFQSYKVLETANLAGIITGTRIHFGVIIALVLCIALWLFLFRSRPGYKIRITGDNALFAKYAGIGSAGIMFTAQIIAGMAAGAGGAVELLGMYARFRWMEMPGYGWTGIVVALLARLNPLFIPLSACFIAYLNVGADIMSRSSDVSSEVVLIIQGVMMLLIAADALLNGWRQRMIVKAAEREIKFDAKS
jgi:simple sugar transport system permease protein